MRGHHLLCALGFRGLGYSAEFSANMAAVLSRLDRAADTPVTVIDTPDAICSAFPADQPGHCTTPQVIERDRRVIAGMGLKPGAVRSWAELRARLSGAFQPSDLDSLCATCPWLPLGYCAQGLAAARRAEP